MAASGELSSKLAWYICNLFIITGWPAARSALKSSNIRGARAVAFSDVGFLKAAWQVPDLSLEFL